ncbi:MAG: flavoprotein [Bacteroidetes bacterium GWC2_33_15]|nr:MAG: flavoprotein [Bacteroidetes bacterium GWA2_33_15]OFX48967.1 MAG: flavoprotein [Bacteroidetes bacterium GWC2_33_15]OFX64769.1 MAG: flavoprotein [Bacteroidetes bacterium GWB2_32_14]OFX68471.1 MAG: flavoprotein [Bacteroidetes bacterium GWD2_33_33]HAN19195.1 aminoacetone oxidase family FAD-binding enzyme [Bacteroidales bacterium]
MKIAIIGGGAAGFFSAISVKENYPDARVIIYEKAQKVLSKVKISGGGRCNLTNGCNSISELCNAYPRGGKSLKKAFHVFSNKDTMRWFESRGVPLVIQSDNCVFPVSQDSQSIIDCFLRETKKLKIEIKTGTGVKAIHPRNDLLELEFIHEDIAPEIFDKIIVTTGGSPKRDGLNWLEKLNHTIENPVPSLFTFKMSAEPITQLMGIVVENTQVSIQGTRIKSDGPLLITHWGMSGPAILKLSSLGARELSSMEYHFKIQVNWANEQNNEIVINDLNNIIDVHPNKTISNFRPYGLQERLWLFLLEKIDIPPNKKWNELGKKGLNKLSAVLTNDIYTVNGKSTYKEEFVTCGGVSLQSIDLNTMQSKTCKNVYFAGEILDIDAITGGFNLQAAWTTGFIAGKLA